MYVVFVVKRRERAGFGRSWLAMYRALFTSRHARSSHKDDWSWLFQLVQNTWCLTWHVRPGMKSIKRVKKWSKKRKDIEGLCHEKESHDHGDCWSERTGAPLFTACFRRIAYRRPIRTTPTRLARVQSHLLLQWGRVARSPSSRPSAGYF